MHENKQQVWNIAHLHYTTKLQTRLVVLGSIFQKTL